MAATQSNTDEVISQLLMKIQSTNYQVDPNVSSYPEELKMLVVALKRSPLSTAMFNSFSVPMSWLSMATSTASYNYNTNVITFNLVNNKTVRLTKNMFINFLNIPNNPPFFKPTNSHIIFMFNEMGHQPTLEKISDFRKSSLPCIWNFLFGIFLRCLTGRSVGLDTGRMEVYAMAMGLYYDLSVDYGTQLWKEFNKSLENTSVEKGISCARYWSLILEKVYAKEGIQVPEDREVAEFSLYQFPKVVDDNQNIFTSFARIPDAMFRKVSATHKVLVRYMKTFDHSVRTGVLLEVTVYFRKLSQTTTTSPTIRKTEVSSKGAIFRDVPTPVSPGSKRRRAAEVAKHITQKLYKKRKLVIQNESSDDEVVPETPPVSTTVTVTLPITSQVSTTISTPLEVVTHTSVLEEEIISDKVINVSNTETPITNIELTEPITSLPPFPLPNTQTTTSSIFVHPLKHPFTTLFPSQSPETPQPISSQAQSDEETEGGGFGGMFEAVHFDSEEEESMIKAAEKRIIAKVDGSDKNNELRIQAQGKSFDGVIKDLKIVTKERHVLFVQDVKEVREDVNFKIEELKAEIAKEIQDLQSQNLEVQKRVDIIADAVTKLATDYQPSAQMIEAKHQENKVQFSKLIQLSTELKSCVSQTSQQTILTPEFLTLKVNTLEQDIQKALALITNFTSLLPKNAPPAFTGVQGGEIKGSKVEDAKTVGKIHSTQLKTTLPILTKSIPSTIVTTKPILKGIVIGSSEGGSSSAKPQTVVAGKGKEVLIEKSKEEKKAEAEAEMEKLRQVQSIMRQRANDPPTMNKGDPAKLYSYETIESKVMGSHLYEFEKKPRRSYDVANSDRCQLVFPINEMMFVTTRYKISEKFKNADEYISMKIRFHVVLAKDQDEVWSLMKIKKVLTIKKDELFENMLQNFRYFVVRADNKPVDFTIADFPMMNLNDLIQVALILKEMEENKFNRYDTNVFKFGFAHIKKFIDNYYDCLALTDEELASVRGKQVTVPWESTLSQIELKKYSDGEICLKPFGMVFAGKDTKGKPKKFLFKVSEIERYTTSQYTNFIVHMNNCSKNNEGDRKELKKIITWYLEIRRTMNSAI
ncbi:hypothetical protein Lser_V15G03290 [Lactuca serriola]